MEEQRWPFKPDGSRWSSRRVLLDGDASTPSETAIHYVECKPPASAHPKGHLLLIHGYPQTSYQFRKVIEPFANAGYHVFAPDYRGAGWSSQPRVGFEKIRMAEDLHTLLTQHLRITSPVHVVGHDIGGMVAHAYAARFSNDTASVAWGECPLPGSKAYDDFLLNPGVWHFHFHWQADLPELLTAGREREYINSFYKRLCHTPGAFTKADVDHYASQFAGSGAMRCGFDVYRAFHQDAKDNREWLDKHGKCTVPALTLNGEKSFLATIAEGQAKEMYESVSVATVEHSGHWCAEENPADFVKKVLDFIKKH